MLSKYIGLVTEPALVVNFIAALTAPHAVGTPLEKYTGVDVLPPLTVNLVADAAIAALTAVQAVSVPPAIYTGVDVLPTLPSPTLLAIPA